MTNEILKLIADLETYAESKSYLVAARISNTCLPIIRTLQAENAKLVEERDNAYQRLLEETEVHMNTVGREEAQLQEITTLRNQLTLAMNGLEWYADDSNTDDNGAFFRDVVAESIRCQELDIDKTAKCVLTAIKELE